MMLYGVRWIHMDCRMLFRTNACWKSLRSESGERRCSYKNENEKLFFAFVLKENPLETVQTKFGKNAGIEMEIRLLL